MASAPALDPFAQSFTLLLSDGTPFNVTLTDLDGFNLYNIRICINWASQLGATLLLLVVLLLLTKVDRRQSPLFILNVLSLAINVVRCLLQCLYYTGAFNTAYAFFSADYSRVTTADYASSITADVFTLLLLICVQGSLIMQARVVCTTMMKIYRQAITAVSVIVTTLAVGFRLGLVIENSKAILNVEDFSHWEWLASATTITATVSICFFCAIFSVKLGFALYQRRKMGLRQFGPMQIVFIMGCQIMIVPAIFAVLQYVSDAPELGTIGLTLVAISLPLSSIWASSTTDGNIKVSSDYDNSRRKLAGSYGTTSASSGSTSERKPSATPAVVSACPPDDVYPANATTTTTTTSESKTRAGDKVDLESQTGSGVRVDRSFTVESKQY
ncbi:MAG: hypothetical protein M1825_002665 [Sarcosagium campestre]|nr:MAG: hypothetical protein M1825_002665 [Sarcosagium campestre]